MKRSSDFKLFLPVAFFFSYLSSSHIFYYSCFLCTFFPLCALLQSWQPLPSLPYDWLLKLIKEGHSSSQWLSHCTATLLTHSLKGHPSLLSLIQIFDGAGGKPDGQKVVVWLLRSQSNTKTVSVRFQSSLQYRKNSFSEGYK